VEGGRWKVRVWYMLEMRGKRSSVGGGGLREIEGGVN
jgi:hypothetical protein